jgi:hypothetical protein
LDADRGFVRRRPLPDLTMLFLAGCLPWFYFSLFRFFVYVLWIEIDCVKMCDLI